MNIEALLQNKNWKTFDLKMTKSGFNKFSHEVITLNQREPQVYIHVSADSILTNEVLRIGSAKNGIVDRWIKSCSGHRSTFLWSIGEDEQYKYKSSAKKYPNYLIFFAGLKELNTKLYVLTCEPKESMENIEKQLMKYFNPIWEKSDFRLKKKFRDYFESNPSIEEKIIVCGGAIKTINNQREKQLLDNEKVPDVINFQSAIKWSTTNNIDNKSLEEELGNSTKI